MLKRKDKTEYTHKQVLTVEWYSRGGSTGMCVDNVGDKMPSKVRTMLINQLLREGKVFVRVEDR